MRRLARLAMVAAVGIAPVCAVVQDAPPASGPDRMMRQLDLPSIDGEPRRLMLLVNDRRIEPPKVSPKGEWTFPWVTTALGRFPFGERYQARFRVFAQDRPAQNDPAPAVARMLIRLWDYNLTRLRLDHSAQFADQLVDVFLCDDGKPGGEHLFGEDKFELDAQKRPRRVNMVYIYDLASFTDALEMAREVAHEYGHATLPPMGGYREPEYWSNGELGERLYLSWLARDLKEGRLVRGDALGATAEMIAGYLARKVEPLMQAVALSGPDAALLKRRDRAGMDAYLGLAMWAERIMPERAFGRSLLLTGSQNAEDYPKAIADAAAEVANWTVRIPESLKGQPVWIPLGKGKLGGAAGLKRKGDWVQIRPGVRPVIVSNPPSD